MLQSIPKAFTKHLKSRRNNKTAILKRGGQKWPVKIVDHWVFGEGWETFVRGNGVQDFDFVFFKHEGDLVFDTIVFNASCCERDYPSNKVTIIEAEKACPEAKSLRNCIIDTSGSETGNKLIRCHSEADGSNLIDISMKSLLKAEGTRIPDQNHHPCFIRTLKSATSKHKLYLPKAFALSNGLINGEIILKNVENEGSWKVNMTNYCGEVFYVHHGWREFCIANGLEQGDSFQFELIKKGEKPVANISRISKKTPMVNAAHNPCFKSTATPYSIKNSLVNIPSDFARSNGLDKRNCEMIVMDEKRRLWPTKLCCKDNRVRIKGSREMQIANGLKEGDEFLFELVDKGNKPLMNFHNNQHTPEMGKKLELQFEKSAN
ncbi:B3 domain-containing protein REM10-like [Cynara cardunculus var. scolymus]|uniref:B3 domain-containing protein REM10-like n=1 Tax=Cynara cardunculus var. scolymus TaxID=59895 RepID=UPI000D62BAD4|nr:B3 domain-containing protein REM10-like [Cynara cardunculus var. scolymus]